MNIPDRSARFTAEGRSLATDPVPRAIIESDRRWRAKRPRIWQLWEELQLLRAAERDVVRGAEELLGR